MNRRQLLLRLLNRQTNVPFMDLVDLVEGFGFQLDRTRGSHHIFVHSRVREVVNLQERRGEAKPYQIRQFLKLVEQYDLQLED
jgi:predicted RNA binding protein YcfA (HicA-like mRNA interferase family)